MGKFEETFYRNFGYFFTQKLLFLLFMACFAPFLAIPLYFLLVNRESDTAKACFLLPLLGAIGFSWFFSRKTARFMVDDNIGFKNAFLHSILPYFSIIEFLPFSDSVRAFIQKNSYSNPYIQEDHNPTEETEREIQ